MEDLGPLGRDPQRAVELDRAAELLGGHLRLALRQRGLAERVRERRERVGVSRARGDPGERLGAGVRLVARARCGRTARPRQAQPPDGVVVILALLPAREQEAAALERLVGVAVVVGDERQRGGAVDLHREDVEAAGRSRSPPRQVPPGRAELAAEPADEAEHAVGDGADAVALVRRRSARG